MEFIRAMSNLRSFFIGEKMTKIEEFFWNFYYTWNGNPIDTDGFGAQCVSLFKKYLEKLGDPQWRRPLMGDGYAHQIAYLFHENHYDEYFDWVTGDAQIGDVLVYKVYPGATPYSHVSFFLGDADPYNHYSWGQNQGTWNMASNTIILPNAALLAVLRPKGFNEPEKPQVNESGFSDVPMDAYFAHSIKWAHDLGLITGSDSKYRPLDKITRADALVPFYRMKGSPKISQVNPFVDIAAEDYFYPAVMWATQTGITTGTGQRFRPKDHATRAEIVTFLYRLCGSPDIDAIEREKCPNCGAFMSIRDLPFKDVKETDYFFEPICWAYHEGIVTGKTRDQFDPYGYCSRADYAVMLDRTYHRK